MSTHLPEPLRRTLNEMTYPTRRDQSRVAFAEYVEQEWPETWALLTRRGWTEVTGVSPGFADSGGTLTLTIHGRTAIGDVVHEMTWPVSSTVRPEGDTA